MKKNGFMFVESLTVLVIVVLSLTLLITSYSLVTRKSKEQEYYDLPSDKYLLYTIGNLGDTSADFSSNVSFIVNKDNCNSQLGDRMTNCSLVFEQNNLVYFAIIHDLKNDLCSSNVTSKYDSALLEYLKTLKRCNDNNTTDSNGFVNDNSNKCSVTCNNKLHYAVGVFYRNNHYYYASLEL